METGRKSLKEKRRIKASMTVEASLLLPLFILLFMNLLSVIEVYRIHANVAVSLWERGREESVGVYLRKRAEEFVHLSGKPGGDELQALIGSFGGHAKVAKNLEEYPIWEKIVTGGKAGFLVTEKIEEDGTVKMSCVYRIHPLFAALTPVTKELKNQYYGHAWVGYVHSGEAGDDGDTYVYITESGTVYHKNRGCSYLNPSIQQVNLQDVGELRNRGGAIYYACALCGGDGRGGGCYITDYGTNYHASISCSGLKRTIYEVKLSEVGARGACSRCGG